MTITFPSSPATPITYGECRVYTRSSWSDEWTALPGLIAREIVWSVSPSLPTALLSWNYGRVKGEGQTEWITRGKLSLERVFIKIEVDTQYDAQNEAWIKRTWVGVGMYADDREGGYDAATDIAFGEQLWTCHGIEQLLHEQEIRVAYWRDGSTVHVISRPLTFNARRRDRTIGNRTATADGSGVHQFAKDPTVAGVWSTVDAVDYLLAYHSPRSIDYTVTLPIARSASFGLPNWDQPVLSTEGKTVYSLLAQLIDRRRLRVWWLEYDSQNNVMVLTGNTLNKDAVTLPLTGSPTIPANTWQEAIQFDESPYVTAAVRSPAVEICDQVVTLGAAPRCVGSFSYKDGTLADGWNSTQETAYKAGATGEAGYANWSADKKQAANAQVRSRPNLQNVYSYFIVPHTWNRKVKNGNNEGTATFLFPALEDHQNYHELFLDQSLPLLEGVDYGGTKIADGTVDETAGTGLELAPIVMLKRPKKAAEDPDSWIRADAAGLLRSIETVSSKNDHLISCNVIVPQHSKGICVKVQGQPQHVLAQYSWPANTRQQIDARTGHWDYHDGMIVTLSIPEDRRLAGLYPPNASVAAPNVRRKCIDAGEAYRETYVAPGTVVDLAADGTLVRSTGGYYPPRTGNYAALQLEAIAKLAFSYYGVQHYALSLDSRYLPTPAEIGLGMLITTIGNEDGAHRKTINSVVTELRVHWPLNQGEENDAPRCSLQTWAGELDAYAQAIAPLPPPLRIQQSASSSPYLSGETVIPNQISTQG